MSLTNIKLPDNVIADLYRQSLVQDESLAETMPRRQYEAEVVEKAAGQSGQSSQAVAEQPTPAAPTAKDLQPAAAAKDAVLPRETGLTPESNPAELPATKPSGYKSLGNNEKNVTVIVQFANEVFLPESELQFLTKMLGACKLNLADVAIVNHAAGEVAIDTLKEQLKPRHLLLFGVEPSAIQLPISFPAYKEQAYAGTNYLYAPALESLNQETEEAKLAKRKLWDCLKKMFV